MFSTSGAPSAHSLVTSFGLHGLALIALLLVPAGALVHIAPPEKEVDVVFHRPPPNAIPVPPPPARGAAAGPRLGAHPPRRNRSPPRRRVRSGRGSPNCRRVRRRHSHSRRWEWPVFWRFGTNSRAWQRTRSPRASAPTRVTATSTRWARRRHGPR